MAADPNYLSLVGEAIWSFQRLEWSVVYAIHWQTGVHQNDLAKLRFGQLESRFVAAAGQDPVKFELVNRFMALRHKRHDLVHATPSSQGEDLRQLLHRDGEWIDEDWLKRFIEDVNRLNGDMGVFRPPGA